jgi:hypothetical protein
MAGVIARLRTALRRPGGAFVAGLLLIAAVAGCAPPTTAPSLAGETFRSSDPAVLLDNSCFNPGWACEFTATADAAGPYPGTATITGSFTLGEQTWDGTDGYPHGAVLAFTATFDVVGPAGAVHGTLALDPELAAGATGGSSTGNAHMDDVHFVASTSVGRLHGHLHVVALGPGLAGDLDAEPVLVTFTS